MKGYVLNLLELSENPYTVYASIYSIFLITHFSPDLGAYLIVIANSFQTSRKWGLKMVFDLHSPFKRSMKEISLSPVILL